MFVRVPDGAVVRDWATAGRTRIIALITVNEEPAALVFKRHVARILVVVAAAIETFIHIPNGDVPPKCVVVAAIEIEATITIVQRDIPSNGVIIGAVKIKAVIFIAPGEIPFHEPHIEAAPQIEADTVIELRPVAGNGVLLALDIEPMAVVLERSVAKVFVLIAVAAFRPESIVPI